MYHTIFDLIIEDVKSGNLDVPIRQVEDMLKERPASGFHKVIQRNLLHMTEPLMEYINTFFSENIHLKEQGKSIEALYAEMNGFTINCDRWFLDLYGYTEAPDPEDMESLQGFNAGMSSELTIGGFEDLQQVYADHRKNKDYNDPELSDQEDMCTVLVILRLQELFRAAYAVAAQQGLPWTYIPLYVTAHDHELIYKAVS